MDRYTDYGRETIWEYIKIDAYKVEIESPTVISIPPESIRWEFIELE